MKSKILLALAALIAGNQSFAAPLQIEDPTEKLITSSVSMSDINCKPFAFGSNIVMITDAKVYGKLARDGSFTSGPDFRRSNCKDLLASIKSQADATDTIAIEVKLTSRIVLRMISSPTTFPAKCEIARQELLHFKIGDLGFTDGVTETITPADCPSGIYPPHVNGPGGALLVLHSSGIPTKP